MQRNTLPPSLLSRSASKRSLLYDNTTTDLRIYCLLSVVAETACCLEKLKFFFTKKQYVFRCSALDFNNRLPATRIRPPVVLALWSPATSNSETLPSTFDELLFRLLFLAQNSRFAATFSFYGLF